MPADNDRYFDKVRELILDSVTLDLEDGVAFDKKPLARSRLTSRLQSTPLGALSACTHLLPNAGELLVRVNGCQNTEELIRDLRALEAACAQEKLELRAKAPAANKAALPLRCRPSGLLLPKVESAKHLRLINAWVDEIYGPESEMSLLLAIETAKGFVDLRDILSPASSRRRVEGLIFASEDFCADMGMHRTPAGTEMLWARSHLVAHARAYRLQAIDMVCIQYKDRRQLLQECQDGISLGFDGKQAIHPGQIADIYEHFQPTEAARLFARKVVDQSPLHEGKPFVLDGIVVDLPVVKWAENLLYSLVSNPTFAIDRKPDPTKGL